MFTVNATIGGKVRPIKVKLANVGELLVDALRVFPECTGYEVKDEDGNVVETWDGSIDKITIVSELAGEQFTVTGPAIATAAFTAALRLSNAVPKTAKGEGVMAEIDEVL